MKELKLRYGMNPHQTPARLFSQESELPLTVVNGSPGFINVLDGLNSWQLVRELDAATGLPAAASFKHLSPAGAAVGVSLSPAEAESYFVRADLGPLATAYARARGADRVSSYGDWVALSRPVDRETARLLQREVSDGVIAPGYAPGALELLKGKRGGGYCCLQIDANYTPPPLERREVFGLTMEQQRNTRLVTAADLRNVVTRRRKIPAEAQRDLLIALISLKYTQSNSVALAYRGQTVGIGAGQQSRIHCTRLAMSKARVWFLRQHPAAARLPFVPKLTRQDRDRAIGGWLEHDPDIGELFDGPVTHLTSEQEREWLAHFDDVCLGSDGFFPFRDNIDVLRDFPVRYVAQPGGSMRDEPILAACDERDLAMVFTGLRLFCH